MWLKQYLLMVPVYLPLAGPINVSEHLIAENVNSEVGVHGPSVSSFFLASSRAGLSPNLILPLLVYSLFRQKLPCQGPCIFRPFVSCNVSLVIGQLASGKHHGGPGRIHLLFSSFGKRSNNSLSHKPGHPLSSERTLKYYRKGHESVNGQMQGT